MRNSFGFDHGVGHYGVLHCRASLNWYVPSGRSPDIGRIRLYKIGSPADAEEAWSMYPPEPSHAPCLQCCSAVAWSRGSRGMADAMIEAAHHAARSVR